MTSNLSEFAEMQSVSSPWSDRSGITAIAFDLSEELLWIGNQMGQLASYWGIGLQKYTAFRIHSTNEIRQLLSIDRGILALTSNSLRCQLRRGIPIFNYTSESLKDMQCMIQLTPETLLVGGHQNKLIEIDLVQLQESRAVEVDLPGCAILRQHPRYICTGDVNGKITLLDPNSLSQEHTFDAHSGTLSDFDVHQNLLVTCGFSRHMGSLTIDRFIKVFDLRMLREVAPIQTPILDPFLLRFVPTFTSRLAVVTQLGEFQLVETGLLDSSSCPLYQVNTEGSQCLCFDVSSTFQCLAFGDTSGYLHIFGSTNESDTPTFNAFSNATEFPTPIEPITPIDINDEMTPYSTVPMGRCPEGEKLLSDWPANLCKVVYRRPIPLDPDILKSMRMVQNIGYAPKPTNRLPNQVPYRLGAQQFARSRSESPSELDSALVIPIRYQKIELKVSKPNVEEFDYILHNKTAFSGLEDNLPNSYCNAMLQVLYFIEPLRAALLAHTCTKEFCLSCELSFLFHMLDISKGIPCQANNFLRAFRTVPEASALGLILGDSSNDQKKKSQLCRLIQSWNRFILQQIHADTMVALPDVLEKSVNVESDAEKKEGEAGFESSDNAPVAVKSKSSSVTSRICETQLFTNTRCKGGHTKQSESSNLVFSMVYPEGKANDIVSFGDVMAKSLCLEQSVSTWCETCEKYQPTTLSKCIKALPDIFCINLGMESRADIEFWQYQLQLKLFKAKIDGLPPISLASTTKPCRYGENCTKRPNCIYLHGDSITDTAKRLSSNAVMAADGGLSWLPLSLSVTLIQNEDGNTEVEIVDWDKIDGELKPKAVMYDLYAVVNLIKDGDCESVVSCIKVGPQYHERLQGSPVSQWYIFNDFTIEPISESEVVWFPLTWKMPCVVYFARSDLSSNKTKSVLSPITADMFVRDSHLMELRNSRRTSPFVPLAPDEILNKGDIVAIDAEFVSLNQEESELRSDGTKSTIRPSFMSVARVTCVRGQGALEGVPFIDDYISTQEQVVDYLTKFSGIKPGDLNANISSKHLTTLKSTYMKLRYLIDREVIFVGHGLKNDFRVINLVVPGEQVIDTVLLFHKPGQRMISLKFLAWHFLNIRIQSVTHDSTEDARTALKLYQHYLELKAGGKVDTALRELYETGRKLQWKIPSA